MVAIELFFLNYSISLKIDFGGSFGIANNKMGSEFKMAVKYTFNKYIIQLEMALYDIVGKK